MYDQKTRTHTLTGLTVNIRYTCCVEANFEQEPHEIIGCNSIKLTPSDIGNPNTDNRNTNTNISATTPTGLIDYAQTVEQAYSIVPLPHTQLGK